MEQSVVFEVCGWGLSVPAENTQYQFFTKGGVVFKIEL